MILEVPQRQKTRRLSASIIAVVAIISLLTGVVLGYFIFYSTALERIDLLQDQLSTLQQEVSSLKLNPAQNITYVLGENMSLSQLYERIKASIVVIRGVKVSYDSQGSPQYYTHVQGSGFVYNFTGEMVVLTNYHVVSNTVNITITFINGNGYAATVIGSDPYVDLAVLSAEAPEGEYKPLKVVSSSSLRVGDPVIAVGSPFGLTGTMTVGIVSALGRTIDVEATGGYPIANVIQITAPINPGNSGGPLLDYRGQVIGITTAIVAGSQGLGFAIPSNTILREIDSLVNEGSYNQHPWLGAAGVDMSYEIADAMNASVTYGWLIVQVVDGGPADEAGLRGGTQRLQVAGRWVTVGGDILIAINETRITGINDLSTYLEEYASPSQTVDVTIVRNNQTITLKIVLGTRPPPSPS